MEKMVPFAAAAQQGAGVDGPSGAFLLRVSC